MGSEWNILVLFVYSITSLSLSLCIMGVEVVPPNHHSSDDLYISL